MMSWCVQSEGLLPVILCFLTSLTLTELQPISDQISSIWMWSFLYETVPLTWLAGGLRWREEVKKKLQDKDGLVFLLVVSLFWLIATPLSSLYSLGRPIRFRSRPDWSESHERLQHFKTQLLIEMITSRLNWFDHWLAVGVRKRRFIGNNLSLWTHHDEEHVLNCVSHDPINSNGSNDATFQGSGAKTPK